MSDIIPWRTPEAPWTRFQLRTEPQWVRSWRIMLSGALSVILPTKTVTEGPIPSWGGLGPLDITAADCCCCMFDIWFVPLPPWVFIEGIWPEICGGRYPSMFGMTWNDTNNTTHVYKTHTQNPAGNYASKATPTEDIGMTPCIIGPVVRKRDMYYHGNDQHNNTLGNINDKNTNSFLCLPVMYGTGTWPGGPGTPAIPGGLGG